VSTTIAVSLITAVSTLAGASISGYIAFLISRTQSNAQSAIAKSQQLEQRSTERRQIRRDAYLQFLNQLGTTEQVLESLWLSEPPDDIATVNDFVQAARNAVSELRRTTNLVVLEGPPEVAHIAQELGVWMTLECADLVRVAKTTPKGDALCQHDEKTFMKVAHKRGELKLDLIAAAQKSLDEVSSSTMVRESSTGTSESGLQMDQIPQESTGTCGELQSGEDALVSTDP
jgi:hypothetical protein